ncbi:uncharacterized protein LOC144441232 [Glandiceps talaboti]
MESRCGKKLYVTAGSTAPDGTAEVHILTRLSVHFASFPITLTLPEPSPNLPGSTYDRRCLEKYSLRPVMQWLLGNGSFEPRRGAWCEISTVTASEVIKGEIRKELEESHICKIAVVINEVTGKRAFETISSTHLNDIIMAVKDVPEEIRKELSTLYVQWLEICKSDELKEDDLDTMVKAITRYLFTKEEQLEESVDYRISQNRAAQMESHHQADVQIIVHQKPCQDKQDESNNKFLAISENKIDKYEMDRAYQTMICKFLATARNGCFSTDRDYIMYKISAVGVNSMCLSRAHVCKNQEDSDPNLFIFFKTITFPQGEDNAYTDWFDVFPVLNIYMAIKAVLLLHKKTNIS